MENERAPGERNGGATGEIRLPGSLAGLAKSRQFRPDPNANGSTERRGPLISEISTSTNPENERRHREGEESDTSSARGDVAGEGSIRSAKALKSGRGGRGKPLVKKGFLSAGQGPRAGKNERPLYPPEGSENGSEPGSYAKLMSRCKVVDTSSLSKEQVTVEVQGGHRRVRALRQWRLRHEIES